MVFIFFQIWISEGRNAVPDWDLSRNKNSKKSAFFNIFWSKNAISKGDPVRGFAKVDDGAGPVGRKCPKNANPTSSSRVKNAQEAPRTTL